MQKLFVPVFPLDLRQVLFQLPGQRHRGLFVEGQLALAEAALAQQVAHPHPQVFLGPGFPHHLVEAVRVQVVEVPLLVFHPPARHHVAVEPRVEEGRVARSGHPQPHGALGLGEEEPGQVVVVLALGAEDAGQAALAQLGLQAGHRGPIPVHREPPGRPERRHVDFLQLSLDRPPGAGIFLQGQRARQQWRDCSARHTKKRPPGHSDAHTTSTSG